MLPKFKNNRILIWAAVLILISALAWAVDAFMAQADKIAMGAADLGAKNELVNMDITMLSPVKQAPFDWSEVEQYKGRLESNTKAYAELLSKAAAEKQAGPISEATRNSGLACAEEFNKMSGELAELYEKGDYSLRAKTAREVGQARLKNAQMAFTAVNVSDLDAFRIQSDAMFNAAMASLEELKDSSDPKVQYALLEISNTYTRSYMQQIFKLQEELNNAINLELEDSFKKSGLGKEYAKHMAAQKEILKDVPSLQQNAEEVDRMFEEGGKRIKQMKEGTYKYSPEDRYAGMSPETVKMMKKAEEEMRKMGIPNALDYDMNDPQQREEYNKKMKQHLEKHSAEIKKQNADTVKELKAQGIDTSEMEKTNSAMEAMYDTASNMDSDPKAALKLQKQQLELMKMNAQSSSKEFLDQHYAYLDGIDSKIKKGKKMGANSKKNRNDPKQDLTRALQYLMASMQDNMNSFTIRLMEISIAIQERNLEAKP